MVCPDSLKNVKQLWMKEISEHGKAFSQTVPCILVGTKTDLRTDERTLHDLKEIGQEPVTFEQAQQFANENGFYFYRECSALKREGIEEVIQSAIEAKIQLITKTGRRTMESSKEESTPKSAINTTTSDEAVATPVTNEETLDLPRSSTDQQLQSVDTSTTNEVRNKPSHEKADTQQQANLMLYPWLVLVSLMKCQCEIL